MTVQKKIDNSIYGVNRDMEEIKNADSLFVFDGGSFGDFVECPGAKLTIQKPPKLKLIQRWFCWKFGRTSRNDRHSCEHMSPSSGYGGAISHCVEDEDGKFWVGNGEYESRVNYCPFCGVTAPTKFILGYRLG